MDVSSQSFETVFQHECLVFDSWCSDAAGLSVCARLDSLKGHGPFQCDNQSPEAEQGVPHLHMQGPFFDGP